MLHHLPFDVASLVFQFLDDRDLCALSILCRTLHIFALDRLFANNRTFRALPTWLPSGSAHVNYRPVTGSLGSTSGRCIYLTERDNLVVLLGLCLALPCVFDGIRIAAIVCTLPDSAQHQQLMKEVKMFQRFLLQHSSSSSIEAVVLQFNSELEMFVGNEVLAELTRFFGRDQNKTGLPSLTSLSLLHGAPELWSSPFLFEEQVQLRRWWGFSTAANALRTLKSLMRVKVSLSHSKPKRTTGMQTLHIHDSFVLAPCTLHLTLYIFEQVSHSLRVLALSSIPMSFRIWHVSLPQLSFPVLEELYLTSCRISFEDLTSFLIRHRRLQVLDADSFGIMIADPLPGWTHPPFFLPRLTTLMGWSPLLVRLLNPSSALRFFETPLPALRTVVIALRVWGNLPLVGLLDRREGRKIAKRLSTLTLKLQVHVHTHYTRWLEMPPEDIAALEQTYQSAKVIEIHVWDQPDFLDIEEVRLRLPNWANLFPVLERLEIVDHGTTGWEHRPTSSTIDAIATGHAELREAIMASNPSIKSIHLDVR